MKIGILGHFARNTNICDGQTVKTRNVETALLLKEKEITSVDSYKWKSHPFSFLIKIIKLIKKSEVIIMLPDAGGINVYPYIINAFCNKNKIKMYCVVGGWLPSYLKNHKILTKQLKKFDYILVETKTMKKQLETQNFNNVRIVHNFKDINIIDESEIKYGFNYPLPFCMFSRIMKEKGVNDAILACDKINKEIGKNVCMLDIYGPIQENYKKEFMNLCQKYSYFVKYKGIINPNQSVKVLKKYYMLLFPTLFFTEGIPGTIIDAFSAGVPVIASKWESCYDVLTEKNSIMYEFGNFNDFYEKLKYCVENIEKIDEYRKNCLTSAKKFSLDTAKEKIFNLIYEGEKNEDNSNYS